MALVDLGVIHKSATLGNYGLAKHGAGNVFGQFLWWYDYSTAQQLIRLNLDAGTYNLADGPIGRPYANLGNHPDDGLCYMGAKPDSNTDGQIVSWDYQDTNAVTVLATWPHYTGYPRTGSQCCCYSDEAHKRIFFGDVMCGGLVAWDPVAGTLQDYGVLDDPTYQGDVRYIPWLQIDGSYAYCCMKQSSIYGASNLCYLCIVNLGTGVVTTKWKGTANLKECYVYRGVDGNIYFNTTAGVLASDWWQANGTSDPTPTTAKSVYGLNTRGLSSYTGYALDSSQLYPWNTGAIALRYKKPGDTAWRSIDVTIPVSNYSIQRARADLDGTLISFPVYYSPVAKTDADGNVSELGIMPVMSGYDIAKDYQANKLWLCGYPSMLWSYDLTETYDYLGGNPTQIGNLIHSADPKHFYQAVMGSEKLLWLFAQYDRQGAGTDIIWYDPADGTSGSLKDTNAWLANYDLVCASADLALMFSVVSVEKNDGTSSCLVVVSNLAKKIIRTLYPLGTGAASQGHIVSVETGLSTTNYYVGITAGANYKTYCVNIGTGALVWGPNTITGKTSYWSAPNAQKGQPPLFAHGYVWYYEDTSIVKLDPATGDITAVQDLAGTSNVGMMEWVGDTLYHWDATTKKLFKLTGLA